jgi:hypothetical protein
MGEERWWHRSQRGRRKGRIREGAIERQEEKLQSPE